MTRRTRFGWLRHWTTLLLGAATCADGTVGSLDGSAPDAGGPCAGLCTADRSQVVNCDGSLGQACSPGELCFDGECSDDPCARAGVETGSASCAFWIPVVPGSSSSDDLVFNSCLAITLSNNSPDRAAVLDVEFPGHELPAAEVFVRLASSSASGELVYLPYDPSVGVPPGSVAVVSLAQDTSSGELACPSLPAIELYPTVEGAWQEDWYSGFGTAFHVTASSPVVATMIAPFQGGRYPVATGALLVGDEKAAGSALLVSSHSGYGHTSVVVVAQEDATIHLTTPYGISATSGLGPVGPGETATYSLARGQTFELFQFDDITGTLESTGPLSTFAAGKLRWTIGTADFDLHAIPPETSWGHGYAAVGHPQRLPGVDEPDHIWRVVGGADGTILTWEGSDTAGAPATLDRGEDVLFEAVGPFVVTSQDPAHGFLLGGYMAQSPPPGGYGDPEWFPIAPVTQYLTTYTFLADPTFPNTTLMVTRTGDTNGQFWDVLLDCAGALSGWQAFGAFEYTRVDLQADGQWTGPCRSAPHHMTSEGPFTVTVWGWGSFDTNTNHNSYALLPDLALPPRSDLSDVVPQ